MRHWLLTFAIALLIGHSAFGQTASVIQVTIFLGVNSGCDSTVLDPNTPVDAGSVEIDSLLDGPGFCVFNSGPTAVTLTNVAVTGTDFSIPANPLPFTLQPNKANVFITGANFKPTVAGTRTGTISFVDDASGSPQTYSIVGTGFTDFGITFTTQVDTTATVNAGQNANYHLFVLPATSPPAPTPFTAPITVSCSGMPMGASCGVNPQSFTFPNSTGADLFVVVSTTAPKAALLNLHHAPLWWAASAVFAIVVLPFRRRHKSIVLLVALMLICFAISCGGKAQQQPFSGPPGPTPAGTYTFPVTATSNGVSHTRTLTLVVK